MLVHKCAVMQVHISAVMLVHISAVMLVHISAVMVRGSSLIKYIKAGGHGRPFILQREAMGGTGGSPPNFFYFSFLYENFGGEPPVPPIVSTLSFSFFYNN
jgi:hypothetical protein